MSEHAAQTVPCPSCGLAMGRYVDAAGHDACLCGWDSAGVELPAPEACTCTPYSENRGGCYFELVAELDPDCPQHGDAAPQEPPC